MSDVLKEIQEEIEEFFKDISNEEFVGVVDILVYHMGSKSIKISKLSDRFLEETGLTKAFLNYIMEMNNPSSYFSRNPTDIKVIENVKYCFLSISHNRLKQLI